MNKQLYSFVSKLCEVMVFNECVTLIAQREGMLVIKPAPKEIAVSLLRNSIRGLVDRASAWIAEGRWFNPQPHHNKKGVII